MELVLVYLNVYLSFTAMAITDQDLVRADKRMSNFFSMLSNLDSICHGWAEDKSCELTSNLRTMMTILFVHSRWTMLAVLGKKGKTYIFVIL